MKGSRSRGAAAIGMLVVLASSLAGCSLTPSKSDEQRATDACTTQAHSIYGDAAQITFSSTTRGADGAFTLAGQAEGGEVPNGRTMFTCQAVLAGDTYVASIG